jgi:hypothetical protein
MSHPSQFVLERHACDDLPAGEAATTRQHVSACPGCRRFLDRLLEETQQRPPAAGFAGAIVRAGGVVPASAELPCAEGEQMPRERAGLPHDARPTGRRWHRGWTALAAGLTLAAAAWLLFPGRPTNRLKGAGFVVHRQRGQAQEALPTEGTIRAGDALRLVVVVPEATPIAAWSVDRAGRLDRWLFEPMSVPAGEQALPGSAVVQSPCQDLLVVVATGASASMATEARLRAAAAGGLPGDSSWIPPGTMVQRLRCE